VVLAYGENVRIEDNKFEQDIKDSIGLYGHKGIKGEVVIKGNTFIGSSLTLEVENAMVDSNQFKNGDVNLLGRNITFSNSTLGDTGLSVGNGEGQKISKVIMLQNKVQPEVLFIGDKPVHLKDVAIKTKTIGKGLIYGPGNSKSIYDRLTLEASNGDGTLLPAGTYSQCSFQAGELVINRVGKYILNDCVVKAKENLLVVESLYGKPDVTINNSELEVTENIGYGAAIYVLGAQNFKLLDSTILANKNMNNTPLIKIGPYGDREPTKVFNATIKGNFLQTKIDISALDTSNAGIYATPYWVEDNTLYKAELTLTEKDINVNNTLITQ
jgi:hypothetical protein